MTDLDWRDRFIKYINIVGLHEGVSFLYEEEWGDDWPIILSAEDEATAIWKEKYGRT